MTEGKIRITSRVKHGSSGEAKVYVNEGTPAELLNRLLDKGWDHIRREVDHDSEPPPAPPPPHLTPFEYGPLPSPTSIRLLDLVPGEITDPLECNLSVVDLQDNPSYTALSYSWKRDVNWFSKNEMDNLVPSGIYFQHRRSMPEVLSGRHEDPSAVQCNNKHRLDILPNLHDALTQLRKTRPGRYWIDAVCINQADLQERAQQVQMMGRIYQAANLVLVWLGAVPPSMRLGVGELSKQVSTEDDEPSEKPPRLPGENPAAWLKRVTSTVPAAFFVLSRRWFQRVWVVQEILLSKDLVFLCGDAEFKPKQLEHIAAYSGYPFTTPPLGEFVMDLSRWGGLQIGVRFGSILPTLGSIPHFRAGGRWTLEQWLAACYGRKVTDQRDLAYAGLGVVDARDFKIDQSIKEVETPQTSLFKTVSDTFSDGYDKLRSKPLWPVLAPDYTVSNEEVMLNLAACFLSKPDMNYLSYAGQASEYISSMWNMPRATLDWMTATRPSTGPSWHYDPASLVTRTQPPFKTLGGNFTACTLTPNSPRISANGKELSLLAATIDTVDKVWRWVSPELPEELLDMLLYLESNPKTYAHNDNEPFLTAVAHSNLADIWRSKSLSPEITTAGFMRYLQEIVTKTTKDLQDEKKITEQDAQRARLGLPVSARHKAFLTLSPQARADHLWQLFDSIKPTHDNISAAPDPLPQESPYLGYEDTRWRTFYTTASGLIGLGPLSLGEGDKIMLIPGACTPYAFSTPEMMYQRDRELEKGSWGGKWGAQMVSRVFAWAGKSGGDGVLPWKKGEVWKKKGEGLVLLGEAYVRGWMGGEKVDGLAEERGWERITIV